MIDEKRFEEIVAGKGELTPQQATNLIVAICHSLCEAARDVASLVPDRNRCIAEFHNRSNP